MSERTSAAITRLALPRNIKNPQYGVAITPSGVCEPTATGHAVTVEAAAVGDARQADAHYIAAGARIGTDVETVMYTISNAMVLR